jgi:hypothetical protein
LSDTTCLFECGKFSFLLCHCCIGCIWY